MRNHQLYAVVTGDIVGSTRIRGSPRDRLLSVVKSSFQGLRHAISGKVSAPFGLYRGDSFQGVLSRPEDALRAVICIRASLRCGLQEGPKNYPLDARIVVGIGTIEFLPSRRAAEGDGDAFRRSGPMLDKMRRAQPRLRKLLIQTPWKEIDAELDVHCALLDALVNRWSVKQAEAILGQMRGLTQEKIAQELGISQPAVQQRLEDAGGWAAGELCGRYERLIRDGTSVVAYNRHQ